jgi:uncharacterized protein (DUF924 family)
MPDSDAEISGILDFWFAPATASRWFAGDAAFDEEVRARLGPWFERAVAGGLRDWRTTPAGCVALCVLLDQVPRNLFRGHARAFATDTAAREVAYHAIENQFDRRLPQAQKLFLYLPFEHSETLADQDMSCRLCGRLDDEPRWLEYATRHRDVIVRFGRFPHRNAALDRTSTEEEIAFLATPGSSF